MNGKVYLNVPFAEKDRAKTLGAKWDPSLKKWYYQGDVRNYAKFARWLAAGQDDVVIAHEYLYIIEGVRTCFRCGKKTTVIGLGIGEHTVLYEAEDGSFTGETEEALVGYEPLHLAWAYDERDIPLALLRYLKQNYSVRMGYSRTAGTCFANHCDHCGVIQGNWELFHEDSPLTLDTPNPFALRRKLRHLRIYSIGIDENLVLNWEIGYGDNDGLYLKHGKMQELDLSSDKEGYISFQELYCLYA